MNGNAISTDPHDAYANPNGPLDFGLGGATVTIQATSVLYNPSIVALRSDPNSLEAFASNRLGTNTLLLIVTNASGSNWKFVTGPADPMNPDGEVQPLDYDAVNNNRHWEKVGGL